MGIGVLKLSTPREIIYSRDDALNRDDPGFDVAWAEYERTLDRSVLPMRGGIEPAIFLVAPLTLAMQKHIEDELKWSERLFETIAYGVREIRGVSVIDEHGSPVKIEREKTALGERLSDVGLQIFKDDRLRAEIFGRIRQVTGLSPEIRKSNPA